MEGKLSHEDFFKRAILKLRGKDRKGIHMPWSGVSKAFAEYYGEGADVRAATDALVKAGVLAIRPVKGGVMLYLTDDMPADKGKDALAAILG